MIKSGIYIYGAGKLGQDLCVKFQSLGVKISGFIDPKLCGSSVLNLPILKFQEIPPRSSLYIGVLNNFVKISEILENAKNFKVAETLTPPEVFFKLGELGLDSEWYWLSTNKSKVTDLSAEALDLLSPLLDGRARHTLLGILKYRTLGDVDESLILPVENQYLDTSITDFWNGKVRLVDGGAFTGDSLVSFLKHGIDLENSFAFEPDEANFNKLVEVFHQNNLEGVAFQAALSSHNDLASFNMTGSTGSNLNSIGEKNTARIALDLTLINTKISHIKLDVEGSEIEALQGMKNLIKKNLPRLALSVYHRPNDLVQIPNLVLEFGLYSKFDLRNFANQTFETIFYAST
jgi:FkbM family methyltransferase